ncbi:hypothetical protein IV203_012832 [Nitzschia inconspicua]|uniref:Uncharacterized protein n=1 Tax=Nitzschia inconspicua TaxID=303405 RepID=A0A9K3Q6X5_9STRA|nr:hypothetical protein IV203_012832 [Nitzschia inconspicua]
MDEMVQDRNKIAPTEVYSKYYPSQDGNGSRWNNRHVRQYCSHHETIQKKNTIHVPPTHDSADISAMESGTVRQTSAALSTTVPFAPNHGQSKSEYIPMLAHHKHGNENEDNEALVSQETTSSNNGNDDEVHQEITIEFASDDSDNDSHSQPSVCDESNEEIKNETHSNAGDENPFASMWSSLTGGTKDPTSRQQNEDTEIEIKPINNTSDKAVRGSIKSTATSSSFSQSRHTNKARDKAPGDKASGETVLEEVRDFLYQDFDVKAYAKKVGFDEETELKGIVDGLGIEKLSVFAREYSQSSANPCLYGVSAKLLNFKSIEELQQMEEDLWVELREANEGLNDARLHAIEHNEDDRGLITTGYR